MQRIHTNDDAIESEIKAKGKTAARVTPAGIEAKIKHVSFFTAAQGHCGAVSSGQADDFDEPVVSLGLLTFCVLVLRNGFTVTGESACDSPENFDSEIGRKIARENAVNKIWALEGYLLKQALHDQA